MTTIIYKEKVVICTKIKTIER